MADSAPTIDFYWDLGSTNTYFALKLLPPLAERYGAVIAWHPFNLGYVFQSNQYQLMQEPKDKLNNRLVDLQRWANKYNLPFQRPSHFPIKTARALRGALAMRTLDLEIPFINAIFTEYWERDNGAIGDYVELRKVAVQLGVDADEFESLSESEPVRQQLIDSTNTARAHGVFGAPSMIVDGELYWGKDRMEFIEDHLKALVT
ncbi:MAG: 2-hydroxychromene-2-carboxylate isomerase [Pseudomonadota bacterium]